MAEVLLGNIEEDTSDEEIREFLIKYGFPSFDDIEHMRGDGSRPAVLLTFRDVEAEALRTLQPRIHGIFWKSRTIDLVIMNERED